MNSTAARSLPGLALLALAVATPAPSAAQSTGRITEGLAPVSASEQHTTLGGTFQEPLPEPGHLRTTADWAADLKALPAFIADTNFTLKPRT